ncbi:hypothetical protein CGA21_00565 [Pseudomonas sp. PSB11]|nr:hypothetical protein [Pseudomonas sp. PSB11]
MLEDMIVSAPRVLSDEWMLIGRQESTGLGGRIDLLGLNVIPLIRRNLNTCDFARFTGASEHRQGNSQRKHGLKRQTHRSFLSVGGSGCTAPSIQDGGFLFI